MTAFRNRGINQDIQRRSSSRWMLRWSRMERSEVDESFRGLWYFGTVCSFSVPTSLRFTFARSICPPLFLLLLFFLFFLLFLWNAYQRQQRNREETTTARHQQRESRRERSSFWLTMSTVGHNLQVDPDLFSLSLSLSYSRIEIETESKETIVWNIN